jgi:hypothetical protein
MNPNLFGRTELPDNLSSLFRTISMVVPDVAVIARVTLCQYGFTYAEELSSEICDVFNKCLQNFSELKHCDFSLRSIKVVLLQAGLLKLKATGIGELGVRFILDYDDLIVQQENKIKRKGQKLHQVEKTQIVRKLTKRGSILSFPSINVLSIEEIGLEK